MGGLFHKLRHPRRCYVVCTIPRSGSNLLTDGLRDTRRAGMPKQFFLPKAESRYAAELGIDRAADYAAYVRAIVDTKTTRNEVFGFKLMSWYLDDFLARLREAHRFGNCSHCTKPNGRRKSGTISSGGSESNRSKSSMKTSARIMRGRFAQS